MDKVIGNGTLELDTALATKFFARLQPADTPIASDVCVVTHMLPDRPVFLDALAQRARIVCIIPKPSSANLSALEWARERFPVMSLTRNELNAQAGGSLLSSLKQPGRPLVVLDMGGYFAPLCASPTSAQGAGLTGIVEDTENGYQRYRSNADAAGLGWPIYSVARSPLKDPEDYLVGQSVVFSVERLLRSCGQVMHGREAVVFGYGKVGRSIAAVLQSKNIHTLVVEPNAVRSIEALSRGFRTVDKLHALQVGNLLLCASGQVSLRAADLEYVRDGAFIASVTSRDDELDLDTSGPVVPFGAQGDAYKLEDVVPHVTRYVRLGQYFYVLNHGNAVNFLDAAVVGPFIYLVQAELLAALRLLTVGPQKPGFYEVPPEERERIATVWLGTYGSQ